jgi:ketosteroid isomerase-like protein
MTGARRLVTVMVIAGGLAVAAPTVAAGEAEDVTAAVTAVLDRLHRAAAEADGAAYFALFTGDAVFLGTDVTERWTLPEFRAFAEPYFADGRGWTYTASERHVDVAPGGDTAWFDEVLWNDRYGTCRGTGVLIRTSDGWRIAQYHLTIPIPNELAAELTTRIKAHSPQD